MFGESYGMCDGESRGEYQTTENFIKCIMDYYEEYIYSLRVKLGDRVKEINELNNEIEDLKRISADAVREAEGYLEQLKEIDKRKRKRNK